MNTIKTLRLRATARCAVASGRWFGSPARNNLVSAMLSAPKWKRKLRMLLSPRRTRLAQACNMVAADAFNRGDTETFELVLKRADVIWAEILWPNVADEQRRGHDNAH